MDRKLTLADRLAEKVARLNGSWANVGVLLVMTLGWALMNYFLSRPFDPYPYVFFNLLLAVLVAIQGPLLMMSQNREAREERARAEADFRVNLKNEVAIDRISRDLVTLRETLLRVAEGRPGRPIRAATPPRAPSAAHCSAVSGTTLSRPWRSSGESAKAGWAFMAASGTGAGSGARGRRSTQASFPVRSPGSG
jgi:uncharacterized membrane protein